MVDVSVGGEETTPVAIGSGVVLGSSIDVEEETVSFCESGCG
jgi:hypothetical protein